MSHWGSVLCHRGLFPLGSHHGHLGHPGHLADLPEVVRAVDGIRTPGSLRLGDWACGRFFSLLFFHFLFCFFFVVPLLF